MVNHERGAESFRSSALRALALASAVLLSGAMSSCADAPDEIDVDIEQYPRLDNETIGLLNTVRLQLGGDPSVFPAEVFGEEALEAEMPPMLGLARYLTLFAAYATSQAADVTPAYRAPYAQALDSAIQRLLDRRAWQSWMTHYGDDPIRQDNLMYKGYLFYVMALHRGISGDPRYESDCAITWTDGRTFASDLHLLADVLSAESRAAVDSAGQATHSVCCEPGWVFPVCNTMQHAGFVVYDGIFGTAHAQDNALWMEWVEANMVDPVTGLVFSLYEPNQEPPARDAELSGIFNAAFILFADTFDHEWAASRYPIFRDYFVIEDAGSLFGEGTASATDVDDPDDSIVVAMGRTALATGATMALARAFGDEALYTKLLATWELLFEAPVWSPDGTAFGHHSTLAPTIAQNGITLWARATSAEHNIRTLTLRDWSSGLTDEPHVAQVSNEAAFVNRAVFDAERGYLVVTLNGGDATVEPTEIVIRNLSEAPAVYRNGVRYEAVEADDDDWVVTTPPLTAEEETYVVVVPPSP